MSAITAASIKYSEPFKYAAGGLLFTVTNIEVPATTEEYVEGGIELSREKLGLTTSTVAESKGIGQTASGFAGAIWCDGVIGTNKTTYEAGKQVAEAYVCNVVLIAGVPWLRVYAQETAGIGKPLLESKTATKTKLSGFSTTIYCIGR